MKNVLLLLFVFAFACGCDNLNRAISTDTVILEKAMQLQDGSGSSWNLSAGRYKLELSSANGGADVEWIGASCTGASESQQYSVICDMLTNGQLIIKNPTLLGLGPSINISVKITSLVK